MAIPMPYPCHYGNPSSDAECLPVAGSVQWTKDGYLSAVSQPMLCLHEIHFPQSFFGILLSLGLMARSQAQ